jgi:hypothetical protein
MKGSFRGERQRRPFIPRRVWVRVLLPARALFLRFALFAMTGLLDYFVVEAILLFFRQFVNI